MASETSRELAPLVKRADEIQAHHPLMAYYCACPSSRATERLLSRRVNNRTTRAVARRVSSLRLTSEPARATHRSPPVRLPFPPPVAGRMRAVELGMSAPPDARPRKLIANLVDTLERTKADAGVVDGAATDFESCKRFALSVYARADRGDRARPPNDVPTNAHVEAFSAAGTFLKALEHFGDFFAADAEDLATRRKYAEWRAWDLATAAKARRSASLVGERDGRSENAQATTKTNVLATNASAPATLERRNTTTPSPRLSPPRRAFDAYPAFDAPASSVPVPPVPVSIPAACLTRTPPREEETRERWRPDWGGGGPHAVGASVLYSVKDNDVNANDANDACAAASSSGFAFARVVAVDHSVDPPAYVIEVDGAERSTEATRLAPPPDPRDATRFSSGSGSSSPLPGGALPENVIRNGSADASDDRKAANDDEATDIAGDIAGDGDVGAFELETRLRDSTVTSTSDDARPNDAEDENKLAATTTPAAPHLDVDREATEDAARSIRRAAFAEAHELAMRAAEALDPSSGDKKIAADCLRRALAALEAAE